MNIGESFRSVAYTVRDALNGRFLGASHFAEGDRHRDGGRWAEAAASYRRGLQRHPKNFGLWVQLGHALKESGSLDAAGEAYLKALSLSPADSDLLVQLGHFYKKAGRPGVAVRYYRRALEHGSDDFEAYYGAHASFSDDGLHAILNYPTVGNRSFVARQPRDVNAMYLLFLGREADASAVDLYLGREADSPVIDGKSGMSLLAAADNIMGSAEFADNVLGASLRAEALRHDTLGEKEWWSILEFLPTSGFLPGSIGGADEELNGATMCQLEIPQFVQALYWEILWRPPDLEGGAFWKGRVEGGMPKRAALETFLATEEFKGMGRKLTVAWEKESDPVELRREIDRQFVKLLSSTTQPNAEQSVKRYLDALEEGVPRRQIAQAIAQWHSLVDRKSRPPDWRGLLHAMLRDGPIGRSFARRYGDLASDFLNYLRRPSRGMPVIRNGMLVLDRPTLLALPNSLPGKKLDRRGRDLYAMMIKALCDRQAQPNAHPH
jgi:tetratricopeptide (TPR) repeat protein